MSILNAQLERNELCRLNQYLQSRVKSPFVCSVIELDAAFKMIAMMPDLILPSEWQPMLFGELEFESELEAMSIMNLVNRFYNQALREIREEKFDPLLCIEDELSPAVAPISHVKTWCDRLIATYQGVGGDSVAVIGCLFPFAVLAERISLIGEQDNKGDSIQDDSKHKLKYLEGFERNLQVLSVALVSEGKDDRRAFRANSSNSGANVIPFQRPAQKPGRNDPCPCGSGLKFKKCCLNNPEKLPGE